ncbi:hypothetical protein AMAG_12707 [Allomyces macrogynus ATCC 38327]|uniref:Uncharacterized protein n=1 Tax=Allomyces macrogynus (strain ATCC 38327) TaxID=578462 RepID=A0A0L0T1U1_ALLM3|nr:hypothetical protein AMAG_12707 [Allomyces macrogynus ATCC 38327]|eukprot:KNE68539.1 hypothetical protein AMAG_12707 [Allomyces macrogynus ATCC 38327]
MVAATSNRFTAIACVAALCLAMIVATTAAADTYAASRDDDDNINVISLANPRVQACHNAMTAALAKPCAKATRNALYTISPAWNSMVSASNSDRAAKEAQYLSLLSKPLDAMCTPTCAKEFQASDKAISDACSVLQFPNDEKFDVDQRIVQAGSLLGGSMFFGWQAACMRDPVSGDPCGYSLPRKAMRANLRVVAAVPAPPFAFAAYPPPLSDPEPSAGGGSGGDKTAVVVLDTLAPVAARAAFDEAVAEAYTSCTMNSDAKDVLCGGCAVAARQVRIVDNRSGAAGRAWQWLVEKNVAALPTGDSVQHRATTDRDADAKIAASVQHVCGWSLNVDAKTLADAGLKVDDKTMLVDVPFMSGFDHGGLGAGGIVGIVLVLLVILGGGAFLWIRYQRQGGSLLRLRASLKDAWEMHRPHFKKS